MLQGALGEHGASRMSLTTLGREDRGAWCFRDVSEHTGQWTGEHRDCGMSRDSVGRGQGSVGRGGVMGQDRRR